MNFRKKFIQSFGFLVLMAALAVSACKDSSVSSFDEADTDQVKTTTTKGKAVSSEAATSGTIIIDDFNGPNGSWAGDFPGKYTYLEDESVLGGARELRSYRNGVTRINASAGTLEWGGTNTSTEYALYIGSWIGTHGTPTKGSSPHGGKAVNLDLNIGIDGALVFDVLNVSFANSNIDVYLSSSTTGWFYHANVTLSVGEVVVPLSSFKHYGSANPMPAEAADDIDGVRLDGFAHNDQGSAGTGTVFGQIAYTTGASIPNIYVSDSSVMTWDPVLPSTEDRNWPTTVCYQGNDFGLTANWVNPHNAFVVTNNGAPHPWDNSTFDANWINSYNSMDSDVSNGPGGHNWSKYETQVSGDGDFVIQLLADNCSWVYLADENGNNPRLIGFQPAVSTPGEYGVTLSGDHTLTFVIFDGGGLAGGKFRLETTDNPLPPIVTNEAPVADAGADQTVTATGQTTPITLDGSGSSDADGDALTYSWTLDGNEVSTSASFNTNLADGNYTFTLTVSDGEESDSDEVSVTVVNTVPVANAGADQTIEATGATTAVTLSGSATDADGDALNYSWSNGSTSTSTTVNLAVGTHTFTFAASDGQGASDSDEVTITIVDTTSPVISFNQEVNSLWPPNHKMVLVATGISASDLVDGNTEVHIQVSSSEAANGKGDGNTDSDYEIKTNFDGSVDVYVRSERSGKGNNGRTYTITMTTSDVAGNSSMKSFEVSVAKSQGRTK